MQEHRFDDLGELEDVKHRLARASRHPLYADLGTEYTDGGGDGDPADPVQIDKYHVVWNNRDDRMAYKGSQRYNLIQHREVIDAIQEAVEATEGSIEKGVIHDYGAHVDGVLVFGDQDRATVDVGELVDTSGDTWTDGYVPPEGADFTEDRLGLGMRFRNSFDGRSKVGGSTMGYRFICQNWMVWGEETIASEESLHIKGDGESIGIDPEFFEDIIGEVFEKRDLLEGAVERAAGESFPREWVPDLLDRAGFGRDYAKAICAELEQMEDAPGGGTTLWHVYNAATSYIDHEKAQDVGPSVYERHHDSAWSILETEPREPEELRDPAAFAAGVGR